VLSVPRRLQSSSGVLSHYCCHNNRMLQVRSRQDLHNLLKNASCGHATLCSFAPYIIKTTKSQEPLCKPCKDFPNQLCVIPDKLHHMSTMAGR
jgi:hypothetical protein